MTKHPDLFAALAAPFDQAEVKSRNQSGKTIHWITARTAMNRLDTVLGPENWWDRYVPGEHSVLCELTIRLPDGSTLTKADAGGYAGMSDEGDDDKSGYSDAFKRAAVKFGVARYLYRDGVPTFVQERAVETPQEPARETNGTNGHAPPAGKPRDVWGGPKPTPPPAPGGNGNGHGKAPQSGKALFAWVREQEQRYSVGLLKYLNNWAKLQEFPGRMVDWDHDQVVLAHAEACRKLSKVESQEVPGE
jgi:hypothetical protein